MLKLAMFRALYRTGSYFVIRQIYNKIHDNPIRFLFAHDIISPSDHLYALKHALGDLDIEEFEKKIRYLMKHYNIVSLYQAIEMINRPTRARRENCIVLTFDDGHKSLYTRVFPMLKRYDIPAVVFLTTGLIQENSYSTQSEWDGLLWYDKLIYAVANTTKKRIEKTDIIDGAFNISSLQGKKTFIEHMCAYLKRQPEAEKQCVLYSLFETLGFPYKGKKHLKSYDRSFIKMLSWEDIREMQRSGLVTFGSHTVTHPILTRIPVAEALREIKESKEIIEKMINGPVDAFAYPNGNREDFDERHIQILEKVGYKSAFTTMGKANNHRQHKMCLNRDSLDPEPWNRFAMRMAGFFDLLPAVQHKLKGGVGKTKSRLDTG